MSKSNEWPTCTAHHQTCGHVMEHEDDGHVVEYARANIARLVNGNGYAICACHPEAEATALGVERFECSA